MELGWLGLRKGYRPLEALIVREQDLGTMLSLPAVEEGMVTCHLWPLEGLVQFPKCVLFSEAWSQCHLPWQFLRLSGLYRSSRRP